MSLSKTYAWYIENNKLALVEASQDNDTDTGSSWASISTADKTIRVLGTHRATDFDTTLTDDNKTYNLPSRFRYALSDYVIAFGYEDPRNQNLKNAGYYLNKFGDWIRRIKKYTKSSKKYGASHIRPHYF